MQMSGTSKRLKVVLTGATGMVGEGVLHECLDSGWVGEVLVIGRKTCGIAHPKLKETLVGDLADLDAIGNRLASYDACIFCAGSSPLGNTEAEYYTRTVSLAIGFSEALLKTGFKGDMCYVSVKGANPDWTGRSMWRRVKGAAERELHKLPFHAVYSFRPALLRRTQGLKNTHLHYIILDFLVPLVEALAPNTVSTLSDLGLAMISAAAWGCDDPTIEVPGIIALAKKARESPLGGP
jgi:hypothetical protein